jgi:hypothetical protein
MRTLNFNCCKVYANKAFHAAHTEINSRTVLHILLLLRGKAETILFILPGNKTRIKDNIWKNRRRINIQT